MKWKNATLFIGVFLVLSESFDAWAITPDAILEKPVFEIEEPKDSIKVGDSISLELLPPADLMETLESGQSFGLEVLEGTSTLVEQGFLLDPIEKKNGKWILRVAPIRDGELTLAPMAVVREKEVLGRTEVLKLFVIPAIDPKDPKSKEKPADFFPPVTLPFPWKTVALWGLLLAALTGLGLWWALKVIRNHKSKTLPPAPAPSTPIKTEDLVALGALAHLESERLLEKELFKKHYFSVSDILKTYLGARYQVDALECTSAELIQLLKKLGLTNENLDRLEKLFDDLDLVKFTDLKPTSDGAGQIIERAREVIRLTRNVKTGTVGSYAIR